MAEEKETAKKEAQKEVDPKLLELIEIMKLIQKEMPNAEKRSILLSFWNTCASEGTVIQPKNKTRITSLA
jgi:hypothetical protein